MKSLLLLLGLGGVHACPYNNVGMLSDDPSQRRLMDGIPGVPGVVPEPLTASGNAFISRSLLAPSFFDLGPMGQGSGTKTLLETLSDFAATQKEEMCYWSWQPLQPPMGGPSLLHPFRKTWDLESGHLDDDLEWVHAYGEVAASRLNSLVKPGGPVAAALCGGGYHSAKRRCVNGRGDAAFCVNGIVNQTLPWPMAVAIFKISHPDLRATIAGWRQNASMHAPNIHWAMGSGNPTTSPWGTDPKPGDVNPPGMPQGPAFPNAKVPGWGVSPGAGMTAKVVPCSQIPEKWIYSSDQFYCDRLNEDKTRTVVDEVYDKWASLTGVWPPTKSCADDVPGMNKALAALHFPAQKDCASAKKLLEFIVPNWSCDTLTAGPPMFRAVCCSVCGGEPMPDITPAEPKPAPAKGSATCSICSHVYDAEKDGNGTAFDDLPDSWSCPNCGAPKSVFVKTAVGDWVHTEQEEVVV